MKRYFRHIIGPVAFVLIIAAAVRFVTSVEFGKLTLNILERVTGVSIEYRAIKGNILQGFRIEEYCVRLSDGDRACGAAAELHYRFNPFMLQLPNLFEINLLEPRVTIEAKKHVAKTPVPGVPNIRLGLRMSVKNGQITYKAEKIYMADGISGIVFADFIGSRMHFLTKNLSLRSEEYSLDLRTIDLDVDIDNEKVKVNSLRVNGEGLVFRGKGSYFFEPPHAAFEFEDARIDLKKVGVPEGEADFGGKVVYSEGNLLPQIRGKVTGLGPFTGFGFETRAAADTVWADVFDAGAYGGSVSGQLRLVGLRRIAFAGDFTDLDAGALLGLDEPVLVNGHVTFKDSNFTGFISSPAGPGLGLDSVWCYGSYSGSGLHVDSLLVLEGVETMRARGTVLPQIDLYFAFADFDFTRFSKYSHAAGRLSGSARLAGKPDDLLGLSISSNLLVREPSVYGIAADTIAIRSENFQRDGTRQELSIAIAGLEYKDHRMEHARLAIRDSLFTFIAFDKADSIIAEGMLRAGLRGTISSLAVNYNRVLTKNTRPIEFDILTGMISSVNLMLADGVLEFSRVPLSLKLEAIDLHKLGRLLGIREELQGMLELSFTRDSINLSARNVDFIGMKNGMLALTGRRSELGVAIDSLHVHDDLGQVLDARGVVSWQHSDLTAKFHNVGIWVLPFLSKFLGDPTGLMTGEVGFKGNIEQFEFNGGGTIHEGAFTVAVIASRLDSVNTEVVFEGTRIVFVSGRGVMSPTNGRRLPGKWISGGGVVKLEKRFRVNNLNFDFSFIDAPVQFPPFAYGLGSGNFSLNMRDRVMHYNGSITVKEAVIPLEFGMKIEEEQAVQDEDWRLNLTVRGERDVWLRNRDADIEFGGDLSIVKETGPVRLSGVMETRRGNYYWLNHILSITQGKVTFMPQDEIDPEVDFWAEMDTREGVKIILHMFGPISEPIFEFYTDPPGRYTEQDIVTYLNLNITWQELEQIKRGEYMSRVIPRSLLSWLEGDISRAIRQYTGLDYFHIETPFFESDEKTRLTVGKYISRNLFVTYTYDITTFSNEFNVEYYIDDRNKIHVERDEAGEYSVQYQYRVRF
ncbi:translocation/assembly module TamB domain-containing protein [candidate division WOR-3 bacterium]|nr:translocation/assembly module TamB domain-containing protein [candidate division WOR-3 bacterium]